MGKNYTVIHGNVVYKVDDVTYDSTNTHRRFKRDDELILSVPLNSVLIMNGRKVKGNIINGLNYPAQNVSTKENTQTSVTQNSSSDDSFLEGAIVGGVIGSLVF
jgi:hypothetical protein